MHTSRQVGKVGLRAVVVSKDVALRLGTCGLVVLDDSAGITLHVDGATATIARDAVAFAGDTVKWRGGAWMVTRITEGGELVIRCTSNEADYCTTVSAEEWMACSRLQRAL